ncbi:MAG TPA: hypothetical protein VN457_03815, partial [Chlamydiales bacterium]|nr:hypothetical protein [Chlamydiales bacterium]
LAGTCVTNVYLFNTSQGFVNVKLEHPEKIPFAILDTGSAAKAYCDRFVEEEKFAEYGITDFQKLPKSLR